MEIRVDRSLDCTDLLSFLKSKGFSHRLISRLKRLENGIMLNGKRVTVRALLHEGDLLTVADGDTSDDVSENIIGSDIPIDIVYEDDYIVIPNKPAGMPTHPSMGHHSDSLANALAYRYSGKPFVFRPVNRLDRDTSGIVLVAKNKACAGFLSEQIEKRAIIKKYIAVLDGFITPESGRIESHIRRKAQSIITRESVIAPTADSRPAITDYRTLFVRDGMSVIECEPLTGRTHQLRVHFADAGTPILGDTLYGRASALIDRQALHAAYISFTHPATRERIEIFAPLHDDMRAITGLNVISKI